MAHRKKLYRRRSKKGKKNPAKEPLSAGITQLTNQLYLYNAGLNKMF